MGEFNRMFVGFPIKHSTENLLSCGLMSELSEMLGNEMSIDDFDYMRESEDRDGLLFAQWVQNNLRELKKLNINLHSSPNRWGNDSQIFGVYVDDIFFIPYNQTVRVDFENFKRMEEIKQIENSFRDILSKLDKQVLDKLEVDKLFGTWWESNCGG